MVECLESDDGLRHRFRSNEPGDGAVVIATRHDGRALFIEIYRPVLDRTFVELPRGQAEPSDSGPTATAERELIEETGYRLTAATVLGRVYPDTGLSGDAVNVVATSDAVRDEAAKAEFPRHLWLSRDEIRRAVNRGEVVDAITLAALQLWWLREDAEGSTAAPH